MRTKQENNSLFKNLIKLDTIFLWRGHILQFANSLIVVRTKDAFDEIIANTCEDLHDKIKYKP
jgi:uncharacterized protein involved in tolerance to divalent cations